MTKNPILGLLLAPFSSVRDKVKYLNQDLSHIIFSAQAKNMVHQKKSTVVPDHCLDYI